jgi:hypothetical protein
VIAGFAPALREQDGGAVLPEVTQQAKHLPPPQSKQATGILDTQPP